MKQILKGLTIAIAGDFGEPRTASKLQQWIERNGGTFETNVKDCTHLVCTPEEYKKKSTKVKNALQSGHVKIVSYDWLEDSLMKKKRRRETEYLLGKVEKAKRKRRQEALKRKNDAAKQFVPDESEDHLVSSGHHIYQDDTHFEYAIVLFRADPKTNGTERYHVKLFESHAVPRLYATTAKYSRASATTGKTVDGAHVLAKRGSLFVDAFRAFRAFFEKKTGYAWEERLEKKGGGGMDGQKFKYLPPSKGEPRGAMPPGWTDKGDGQGEQ